MATFFGGEQIKAVELATAVVQFPAFSSGQIQTIFSNSSQEYTELQILRIDRDESNGSSVTVSFLIRRSGVPDIRIIRVDGLTGAINFADDNGDNTKNTGLDAVPRKILLPTSASIICQMNSTTHVIVRPRLTIAYKRWDAP